MSEDFFSPCIRACGPTDAKMMLVGEAPGADEETVGLPFMGWSGQELTSMLQEVGIERSQCYLTNVLWTRPPENKLEHFLVPKKSLPSGYDLPSVREGKYLHPSLLCELTRLKEEILKVRPNLIVALGNTATWALLGSGKISSSRGTVARESLTGSGFKTLPTYHPAGVLRNWAWRTIVLQDLLKADREAAFPEVRRVTRNLLVDPDWTEIQKWCDAALQFPILSCDIETERGQITSIGLAVAADDILVVPFWDKRKPDYSFWSFHNEVLIWHILHRLLSQHKCILFQNGLYDVQYLWRKMGIPVPGFTEDTMLLHHSLYPELPKGLEFLGSIYTNEISWKKMRPRHSAGETKREE